MVIFNKGSLIGEDDLIKNYKYYTKTLTCISQKGTLFELKKEHFLNLKGNSVSWENVLNNVKGKEDQLKHRDKTLLITNNFISTNGDVEQLGPSKMVKAMENFRKRDVQC